MIQMNYRCSGQKRTANVEATVSGGYESSPEMATHCLRCEGRATAADCGGGVLRMRLVVVLISFS